MDLFFIEKDAIAFLGLMSFANKHFDAQFTHPDGAQSHANGLNIFAAITDNIDGQVIGQQQNAIHSTCNPMMHAEQLALKEAIGTLGQKRPRDPATTSVENYYRKKLFTEPGTTGNYNVGGTIYTTLEPCPFCTAALLVNRMKRIVYIIPDKVYGDTFPVLKQKYASYDMVYQQLQLDTTMPGTIIAFAAYQLGVLQNYVAAHPDTIGTLYLDDLKPFLQECSNTFLQFTDADLATTGNQKERNAKTLNDLQNNAG
ncbi:MAG: hypothetical protein V4557_12680 [Bacteroidota bacterium]